MGTEIFKIDASWAEKLTKTRVSFLMTPTVYLHENLCSPQPRRPYPAVPLVPVRPRPRAAARPVPSRAPVPKLPLPHLLPLLPHLGVPGGGGDHDPGAGAGGRDAGGHRGPGHGRPRHAGAHPAAAVQTGALLVTVTV